jgi:hypothetical protein
MRGARCDRQLSVLRLMPNIVMREAKVDDFIPSNSAAPPGQETFPLVGLRALMMIVSRSWRFIPSRVKEARVHGLVRRSHGILWWRRGR